MRRSRLGTRFGLLGRHLPRFDQQRVNEGVLANLRNDLPLSDDEAQPVPARDADIGFACLAGPVHDAAHHRDPHRHAEPLLLDGRLDALRQGEDVDLGSPARRAGNQIKASLPEPERLQDRVADLDFFDRVVGERDADRVADPVRQQRPDPNGALDRPHRHGTVSR